MEDDNDPVIAEVTKHRHYVILRKDCRKWRLLAAFEAYHLLTDQEKKYFWRHNEEDYRKLPL